MSSESKSLPASKVECTTQRGFPWFLPLCAALFATFLGYTSWAGGGPVVTVFAQEGHGVGVGDPLRYRGVTVGEVQGIELTPELDAVALRIRLEPASEGLCRVGSRFWVVRPHMALDGVQGLETIIGARYLSVLPGDLEGPARYEFTALSEPPVSESVEAAGLELLLEAPTRFNLVPGAQLSYRGVSIGAVLSVELASDATTVEIRAYVRPNYAALVRDNSYFWSTGGLEVNLALTQGLSVEMDSLRSLLVGGISLATPTKAGALAADGARFSLNDGPHEDGAEWRPSLAVGTASLPERVPAPTLVELILEWRQGRLFKSDRQRTGWGLPVEGGVIAPADLLVVPSAALEGSASLRVDGAPYPLVAPPTWSERGLGFRELSLDVPTPAASSTRTGEVPEDCLLLSKGSAPPLALAASRLTPSPDSWRVEPDMVIDESWHGAAVVGRSDGRLLGLLLHAKDGARIVPLSVSNLRGEP